MDDSHLTETKISQERAMQLCSWSLAMLLLFDKLSKINRFVTHKKLDKARTWVKNAVYFDRNNDMYKNMVSNGIAIMWKSI